MSTTRPQMTRSPDEVDPTPLLWCVVALLIAVIIVAAILSIV